MLRRIKSMYWNGIVCSDGFIMQRTYIAIIIAMILLFHSTTWEHRYAYISFLTCHIVSIYLIGFLKKFKKKTSWISRNKRAKQILYLTSNVVFIVLTVLYTKSLIIFGIILLMPALTLIISIPISLFSESSLFKKVGSSSVLMIINVVLLIAVLMPLHIGIITKTIITTLYTFSMPFINVGEDNGISFYSLLSYSN